MIRILLATLHSAMQCRPHQELGNAVALLVFEGMYQFSDSEFVGEGTGAAIAKWLDLDQSIRSGRCRATLTLT
ncbi:hypothetical protein IFO70_38680 [Phormidium tenue FACHB-886]|nr:hypothetical protein [Phormidium tenue FACHB-886]